MVSTLLVSTTSRLKYCSVHQRAWVEALGQWVAFPESTMNGRLATEAACDTCAALVLQTFRAQFSVLYSYGGQYPQASQHSPRFAPQKDPDLARVHPDPPRAVDTAPRAVVARWAC